jgi:SNF2 family DNA or RNA helicase
MLTPDLLHDYQKKAVNFQCTHPHSMLWLDMGLGKTVITLTSIAHLLRTGFLRGVIIVAPIRVIRLVWRQEAVKWEHTKHLKFSMVAGTKDQRTRALLRPADVYMINYENMKWLAEVMQTYFISKGRLLPFNGVVWDEVSKMKNSTTNRVQAWFNGKRNDNVLDHFVWRTGLTGTPASNGYKDLHGQFLVVDGGMRLGKFKTAFMTQWYKKAGDSRKDIPYRDTEEGIKNLIGDITLEMSAEDYNPLPDLIINNVEIEMPDDLRAKYEKLEREFFLVLDSGKEVEAFNQAALTNKCLQFSNGAMYPIAGMPLWEPVHDLKLEALEEILDEAQGSPVLCAYAYRSDAQRIMEKFKHLDPINLTECKSEASLTNAMHRWKSGDCQLMIGHPASMGHGIDGLQKNGHILVWYGLNWSLDLYEQFNARVRRQGQGVPVICHRILMQATLDQAQALALDEKATTQAGLRNAVKQYRLTKGA